MNIATKGEFNPEEFRIKFKAFLAVLAFIVAMVFLLVAMINTAAQTSKYTGTIIGFVTGTLITLIFSYYFGSSEPIKMETAPIHPKELPPIPDPAFSIPASPNKPFKDHLMGAGSGPHKDAGGVQHE